MMMVRLPVILVLIIGSSAIVEAQVITGQNSVKGAIVDAENGSLLPSVTVYIQGTTRGTSTGNDGFFLLSDLADGEYDLVISLVGYQRQICHISLRDSLQLEMNLQLQPRDISLMQVEVVGSEAKEWQKLLPSFSREFLGQSENAEKCRIVNPEVINLSAGVEGDSLRAYTDSTIIVENRGLGYRIHVQLDSFLVNAGSVSFTMQCYLRFDEMSPVSEEQKKQWEAQRAICYDLSFRHFLRSLIHRRLDAEQFSLSHGTLKQLQMRQGYDVPEDSIAVRAVRDSSLFLINLNSDLIGVVRGDWGKTWRSLFTHETHKQSPSLLGRRTEWIAVDKNGNLVSKLPFLFYGFWSTRRLGDELPSDYEPPTRSK